MGTGCDGEGETVGEGTGRTGSITAEYPDPSEGRLVHSSKKRAEKPRPGFEWPRERNIINTTPPLINYPCILRFDSPKSSPSIDRASR